MLRAACWSGCLRACVAGGAFVPPAGACAPPGDLGGAVPVFAGGLAPERLSLLPWLDGPKK